MIDGPCMPRGALAAALRYRAALWPSVFAGAASAGTHSRSSSAAASAHAAPNENAASG